MKPRIALVAVAMATALGVALVLPAEVGASVSSGKAAILRVYDIMSAEYGAAYLATKTAGVAVDGLKLKEDADCHLFGAKKYYCDSDKVVVARDETLLAQVKAAEATAHTLLAKARSDVSAVDSAKGLTASAVAGWAAKVSALAGQEKHYTLLADGEVSRIVT